MLQHRDGKVAKQKVVAKKRQLVGNTSRRPAIFCSRHALIPRAVSSQAYINRCGPKALARRGRSVCMGTAIALDYRRDARLFTAALLYKDPERSFSQQELSQFQVESDLSAILNVGRGHGASGLNCRVARRRGPDRNCGGLRTPRCPALTDCKCAATGCICIVCMRTADRYPENSSQCEMAHL